MEVDNAVEFRCAGRTVVVFLPSQAELLEGSEVKEEQSRDQWVASKETWSEATSRVGVAV